LLDQEHLEEEKILSRDSLSMVNEAESVLETLPVHQGFTEQIDIA
jgi:hypothetical protein